MCTRILDTISRSKSSAGYLQGMNYIVACLYFHAGEVLAYDFAIRVLNDYHLKEVVMPKFPGLSTHTEVIQKLIEFVLPDLHAHFKSLRIDVAIFC